MNKLTFLSISILIILILTGCQQNPNYENDKSKVLGGWVKCDSSYNPILTENFNDYLMAEVTTEGYFGGYLSSLDEGDFHWWFDSNIGDLSSLSNNTFYWKLDNSPEENFIYTVGSNYLKFDFMNGSYYKLIFYFDSNDTAEICFAVKGYSEGDLIIYCDTGCYVRRIATYTNRGESPPTTPSPDIYDPNDEKSSAYLLLDGFTTETIYPNIHENNQEDWFKFNATSGTVYTIEINEYGTDRNIKWLDEPWFYLYDSSDVELGKSISYYPPLNWTCSTDGTYYIKMSYSSYFSETGTYKLSITAEP